RLISRSTRWSGLVVTVTCELLHKLSASVAAPGPHDFAVRLRSFVRACAPEQKRPPHLIPTYSDDGRRPSSGMRRRSCNSDLQNCEAKYFSFRGLTRFLKIRSDLPVVLNLSRTASSRPSFEQFVG